MLEITPDNIVDDWSFPWGNGSLNLAPPESLNLKYERFLPDLSRSIPDCHAYQELVRQQLEFPLDQPRLETRVDASTKVAIVVDDPSRWSPLKWCLPVVLEKLANAGVEKQNISISFGVGRHSAVTQADMFQKLGSDIASQYQCYSPPLDDLAAYEDLGVSADGVPVRVFRPVAKADLRVLIGSVLPHLQAGFGGGWKLIFPGCSHRTTLGSIHQQGLDGDAGRLLGCDPILNPMRQAISRAAKLLPGGTLSISHVIGRTSEEIYEIAVGSPDAVEQKLASKAKSRFHYVPAQPLADLVVVGNAPWPGDPMHSFKTLLNHRNACKPHGVLAGVFWTDPAELGRSFPIGAAKAIAKSGRLGAFATRVGLPLAEKMATWRGSSKRFMMRWARELVLDRTVIVYSPEMARLLGSRLGSVTIAENPAIFWNAVIKSSRHHEHATLFPYGGLTYAQFN
jgi:lactate racemase